MKEGTWHAGILGCFTLSSFNRRVEKCKNKLDPLVYDWIVLNKQMLMQHASSAAKLRGGHLIQFSTNNTNETFNKHIKANLTKMHSASQLIQKMDHFVSGTYYSACTYLLNGFYLDSLKECWLSSIGASDCVKLKVDISAYTENQKLSHFKEIGLSGYVAMGLGCPRSLANGFDYRKVIEEEEKLVDLKITFSNSDVFHLENEKYSKSDAVNRYVTVRADSSGIHCNLCVITLPSYLCCHITLCLKSMEVSDRQRYWTLLARPKPTQPKNGFSKVCGQKPRDRLGTKPSAGNHVRVIKDVTNMSIFDSTSSTMASPAASLNSSSVSTPGDSSRRSSNRHRNRPDRYSPPYGSDTSVMASDVSQNPPSHNVSDFLSSPVY
ncbi:hypothetical protein CRE_25897 [Caenorhabditis remanei]|uniref:Uncharacterized protein n=1 Tax=Caenorhabditis remanei TaxID=31234 RepID=E3NGD7_CAERE|nr:hypothetical protein CRE_25897 [Caenorhabditis remanei]